MNGQRTNYNNYYAQLKTMSGPFSVSEIPSFKIDYRGLIKYAKEHNKKVVDLSDEEKEMFTFGVSMQTINKKRLK